MSDHVFYNAKVYVEKGRYAQAVWQQGGIIRMVGTDEEVLRAAGDAQRIDCGGRTVIPGLNDSHQHLLYMGRDMLFPDLTKASCAQDLTAMGQAYLRENPDSRGFHASGWNEDTWPEGKRRRPCRADLDVISTEVPIVFTRVCAHLCAVNSRVLSLLGIDRDHTSFDGASVEVDAQGEPTGLLSEKALHAALALIPELTHEELKKAVVTAMEYAVSKGLTTVQSNDIGFVLKDQEACCAIMKEVYDEGRGLLRYTGQLMYQTPEELRAYCESSVFNESYADDWFRRGPLKMIKDGSLGARTALLRQDYRDDPGNRGVEVNTDAFMAEMLDVAHGHGMQVAVHVIGNAAIEQVVGLYESVNKGRGNPLRHTLIHCQITDRPLLERIRRDELLIAYQPIFLHYDMHIVPSRCGDALTSTSYAFRTANELGVHASYGTDAPVEDLNPFACIYCAVTRCDLKGQPVEGFYPQERVDVETAVDAYTIESAYQEFREKIKGRIKTGYYADLVVLDRDIFTCDPMEIKDIKPVMTMVGGRIVYQH